MIVLLRITMPATSQEIVFGDSKEYKLLLSNRVRPIPDVKKALGETFSSNVTFKKFRKSDKRWHYVKLSHHPSKKKNAAKPYRVDLHCKCAFLAGNKNILFHRLVYSGPDIRMGCVGWWCVCGGGGGWVGGGAHPWRLSAYVLF